MTSQTVSKTLEIIPLVAAGGIMWKDPSIVGAIIVVFGSITVALINLYGKIRVSNNQHNDKNK